MGRHERKTVKLIYIALIGLLFVGCDGTDKTDKDRGKYYDKVCIEGFVFYEKGANISRLANKLDSAGKPVRCKIGIAP